jgi:hypothetical protein
MAPSRRPDAIIRQEPTSELRLYSIILPRSNFRARIFWISSARRVASGLNLDPALPMCPPSCVSAIPALARFGTGPTVPADANRRVPGRTIHDLPETITWIGHSSFPGIAAVRKSRCQCQGQRKSDVFARGDGERPQGHRGIAAPAGRPRINRDDKSCLAHLPQVV